MTMDPGLQAFVQESRELLEQTEDTLLSLEGNPQDADLIGELFRAVHTIKGAAGLFGFDAVVAFTHIAESVMGRVRDGEVALDDTLLSLFLRCRDHMAILTEHALEVRGELGDDIRDVDKQLVAHLENYLVEESNSPAGDDAPASNMADEANADVAECAVVETDNWHISLRFASDVLRNGMDPLSFIRYLETIGDIESLTTLCDDLPECAEMDPESCYLGFEIDLKSEADKTTIESVFEFVQEDCVIHILPPGSLVSEYVRLIEALPEENLRIGEILTLSGALTQRELDEALAEQAARDIPDSPLRPPHIGEVMVAQGVIEQPVVQAALGKQEKINEKRALEQQLVRVSADKLEKLIDLVGELVISGANADVISNRIDDPELIEATEHMSLLVEQIRDSALSLRMVQIGETFNRFRRVVREVSREVGKDIELKISGADTELDKTVVEKISDPLMHLVRNAIDHGVEAPALRAERGKSAKGELSLNAYHDSGSIVIEVADDGGGLPRDKILAKALENDLVKPNQALDDAEINRLIFEPGFSTANQVSNISGRGVGMDVVRSNIDALRGQVDVASTPSEGSTFTIRLPLTLAIIDGFQVRVGSASYVLPLDMVVECIELDQAIDDAGQHANYVNLRGEVLPFVRLTDLFGNGASGVDRDDKHRDNIVVVRFAGNKTGLVVDELLGEYQTVIKPLGRIFGNLKGVSGATILGSGEVAMIIDVPNLVQRATQQAGVAGTGRVSAGPAH